MRDIEEIVNHPETSFIKDSKCQVDQDAIKDDNYETCSMVDTTNDQISIKCLLRHMEQFKQNSNEKDCTKNNCDRDLNANRYCYSPETSADASKIQYK